MIKTLGIKEKIGELGTFLKAIHSNRKNACLQCGIKITIFNDSGWEMFTEDGLTTQPVCKLCNQKSFEITEKTDENISS